MTEGGREGGRGGRFEEIVVALKEREQREIGRGIGRRGKKKDYGTEDTPICIVFFSAWRKGFGS